MSEKPHDGNHSDIDLSVAVLLATAKREVLGKSLEVRKAPPYDLNQIKDLMQEDLSIRDRVMNLLRFWRVENIEYSRAAVRLISELSEETQEEIDRVLPKDINVGEEILRVLSEQWEEENFL